MTTRITLADASRGRDNNLNLLRMLAALTVLFSHCFTLVTGNSYYEPGKLSLGITLGDASVDVFFAISGFLVTKSLSNSGSLRRYAVARGFRILPGLWVALVLTTSAVCVWFASGSPLQYLGAPDVWAYVLRNAVVVSGAEFGFYGAFADNPYPYSVNASLWTLPLEVWMYIGLALAWLLALVPAARRSIGFFGLLRVAAVVLLVAAFALGFAGHPSSSVRHAAVFFLSAAMYSWRDRIPLRASWFLAAIVVVLVAARLPQVVFEASYRLLLPYIVFYLAYVPGGAIRQYNKAGDYSYGLYIYAFPVQQMVVAAMPGISVIQLFLCAGLLTFVCAIASWHLVETKAMAWREKAAG